MTTTTILSQKKRVRIVLFIIGLCAQFLHIESRYVIEENDNVMAADVKWLAYENSWQVLFSNVDAVDFDVLIFQVCIENETACYDYSTLSVGEFGRLRGYIGLRPITDRYSSFRQ